jgi:hypothetical protein
VIPFDLVIGLFIQVLLWLVVRTVRLIWRGLRSALFEHPLLTLFLMTSVRELGWWMLISPALALWMLTWYPLIVLGLSLTAIARFVGDGGPAAVGRDAFRAGRFLRDLAIWSTAASVADDASDGGTERVRSWWRRSRSSKPEPIDIRRDAIDVRETAIPVGPAEEARS